jgi:hypothetical protein
MMFAGKDRASYNLTQPGLYLTTTFQDLSIISLLYYPLQ